MNSPLRSPELALKCMLAWSERRHLCSVVADLLAQTVGVDEMRWVGDEGCLVYTALSAEELRDVVKAGLEEGESVFVCEFETWSGNGRGIDAEWLLARGH